MTQPLSLLHVKLTAINPAKHQLVKSPLFSAGFFLADSSSMAASLISRFYAKPHKQ
jgi:hypothetical protein